jgi:hypothetical protein
MVVFAPCLIDVFIHHKSVSGFSVDVTSDGNQILSEAFVLAIK